ncbi:MAG: response regulator transcription factor [Treponema sp.]|jgi:DNA-binding NarL/FixJ family response regulator|nr:response regulator transcription factor [Treponema sp.]
MPEVKTVKVMIVEDHPLFSRGLASLITAGAGKPGYSVVGEAVNLAEAIKIAEQEKPALAIVDIGLGEENGMELIPRLKSIDPDIVILVLSRYDERYYSERVLRLGARGYIMKTEPPPKVLDAIKTVMAGKVYLSDSERERIFEAMTGESQRGVKDWAASIRKLSDRELQIFSCLGKGLGTIEIAHKFKLSTKTIDTHKEHIKLKLHCDSSPQLRRFAIEWVNHPDLPSYRENP